MVEGPTGNPISCGASDTGPETRFPKPNGLGYKDAGPFGSPLAKACECSITFPLSGTPQVRTIAVSLSTAVWS